MLKEEFLKLTGLEDISDAEYRDIEQVYEEIPDIDKKDFCTMYRNEDFHQLMSWCKQKPLCPQNLKVKSTRLRALYCLAISGPQGTRSTRYLVCVSA